MHTFIKRPYSSWAAGIIGSVARALAIPSIAIMADYDARIDPTPRRDPARMIMRSGRIVAGRKRPGKYIPGGPNRNCGFNGISPKSKRRAAARLRSAA